MSVNEDVPESMLDRVARLIQSAEDFQRHGETGSAEAALARADAIMVKFAIDRAVVEARKTNRSEREKPVTVKIVFVSDSSDFFDPFCAMFGAIARHCRVKAVVRGWVGEATIVGFPEDAEYAQMIWNSVYLAFVAKIDPKWDTALTADENIKILKEAGRKWAFIASVANEHGFECTSNDGRLKAAYRRQCRKEGITPESHTQRHVAYRASYADGFSQIIRKRIWRQRTAAESVVRNSAPGTAVALRSREDEVWEYYYTLFPHLRPQTDAEREAARKEYDDFLASMSPKEREAYDRAQERDARRRAAQQEAEDARRYDPSGTRAGAEAARNVDLGAGKLGAESTPRISS